MTSPPVHPASGPRDDDQGPDSRPAIGRSGSLGDLSRYFLQLGTLGFGGPIALASAMQRDLVERRGWITDREYRDGLALAQLAPGPLAAQLAIYIGWVRAGMLGATVVGAAFVAPSFLMVLGLATLYVRFGGLPWLQAAFYGIGAAVIAVVARGAGKLVRMSAGRDALLWAVVLVNAMVTAWTERELLGVFVASGLVVLLARAWPFRRPTGPTVAGLSPWLVAAVPAIEASRRLWQLLVFFMKAGAVVFGSGLAIVPFLHGGVVEQHHWLTERQFLDAVAVAMITPGPVVITVAFIGQLVAGVPGAVAAAAGVFLPAYLIVIAVAPQYHRWSANRTVRAFVDGVTAAAAGALSGAVIVLGRRAIVDVTTVLIALMALLVVARGRRIPEPLVILAAGMIGLVVHHP